MQRETQLKSNAETLLPLKILCCTLWADQYQIIKLLYTINYIIIHGLIIFTQIGHFFNEKYLAQF
jgi:hypothetical protein